MPTVVSPAPTKRNFAILKPVIDAALPIVLALLLTAIVLVVAGHNPLEVYKLLVVESFGSAKRIASTLSAATPLIFTGLATAIAFRTGVFNIGVEGCVNVGGLAAAFVGFTFISLSNYVLLPMAILASAIAGTLWMVIPALLKSRLDVDEVVTTLMLNFIAISLTAWLVNGPLLAPGAANSATPMIADAARLPKLMRGSTLNAGFIIGLCCILLYWLWGKWAALGFETRIAGLNARFATASGMNVAGLVFRMILLSGAIGGLAGGVHALGNVYRYVSGFSPGYGFVGIAVALLGRGNAWGMLLAAILFGALATSGATIQLFSDVPIEIVNVLQGMVMIFAAARFSNLWKRYWR
ncbi:ABC transporter permease [Agrobacterium vitis]|uniref:ABC transporter permease n=1 Tax=Agrobacterium vitis TaxID=373 RepID=UPI0009C15627|nr:ABC transporter permease [Agrobacterium vitis]MCE6078276.1 ABC transporter permease [Agrobacterium vitis]MUO73256.1 ABC transporter permease [Agrobacterium vitis]MUO87378.1 ABC transporter permease [Agrobacterium vitis]MVA37917.1 ABC transporter permease [Agrobacterium vitis]